MKVKKKNILVACIAIMITVLLLAGTGCSQGEGQGSDNDKAKITLVFADAGWDSIWFHNAVAQTIIENGYGYKTDITTGSTPITFEGLRRGDIDIYTEVWSDNIPKYQEALDNGEVIELALNFGDNMQGLYVPSYIINGDPEKGIEPLAPDLKSVSDLPKYWDLFTDPEDKNKGRIYGAIPGWAADNIMSHKFKSYGLDKTFNLFKPGSDTALSSSMVQAVEKGKPWVGYYWEPTWIMGMYDMILLEEPEYNSELWSDEKGYNCAFPSVRVTVCVNKDMMNKAPDVVEFLKNYETSSALTSEALAYMQENNVDTQAAAVWFLKNKKEIWTKWVTEDVVKKVEAALK